MMSFIWPEWADAPSGSVYGANVEAAIRLMKHKTFNVGKNGCMVSYSVFFNAMRIYPF